MPQNLIAIKIAQSAVLAAVRNFLDSTQFRVLFYCRKLGGRHMQEHEKTLMTLLIAGGLIGMGRLLVSNEPLSWRMIIGRTILGSATSTVAGLILIQFPDISPVALVSIACALGILGSTYIEEYLKKNINKWGK